MVRYGKVVSADPELSTIWIRVGEGAKTREIGYKVNKATQYWGTDRQSFVDGLRYKGFVQNAEVWYRTAPGDNRTINELRFFDPNLLPPPPSTPVKQ
jgi:hypothetical protein